MKQYHETLMAALESQSPSIFSGGRGMHLIFTPKMCEQLGALIQQANERV
jgi:hypothetical protein